MSRSAKVKRVLRSCTPVFPTFGLICASALAGEFAGGTGRSEDPYQIATPEQLVAMGRNPGLLDKHFVLIRDIDMDPNRPGGQVFTRAVVAPDTNSIGGFQGTVFTGSLDGKGRTIKHLVIRGGTAACVGLFRKTGKAAEIRDLVLEDIHVSTSGGGVAGLVGYNRGRILHCRVTGSISGGSGQWCSHLGLVAGQNSGLIRDCAADGSVSNGEVQQGYVLGMLAGANWGSVSGCVARGTVRGGSAVGGLIGQNLGSIADCSATCTVLIRTKADQSAGGLVGDNEGAICRSYATGSVVYGDYARSAGGLAGSSTGTIVECYATGDVSYTFPGSSCGGLVGTNSGHIVYGYAKGKVIGGVGAGGLVGQNLGSVSQCYAIGQVAGGVSWQPVGGLVGSTMDRGNVTCSLWDVQASGVSTNTGGTGVTTPQMGDRRTFLEAGWDLASERGNGTTDVWVMEKGYPKLSVFSEGYRPHRFQGKGTLADPYRIATAEDLGAVAHGDSAACYRLAADINLKGITWSAPVIPSFQGSFDGNGFAVSNLAMRGRCFLGLFGVLWRDAVVENLTIKDATILAGDSASDLGMVAVKNWGRITRCQVSGSISGSSYEAKHKGIVASNSGAIVDCGPIGYAGPQRTIVTDPKAVREFVTATGMACDQVWIPTERDLEVLDAALRAYLDSDTSIRTGQGTGQEYILANLRQYSRECSGFVRDGTKYIVCSMHLFHDGFDTPPNNYFAALAIVDGGCGILRIVVNAQSKAVVFLECNGVS